MKKNGFLEGAVIATVGIVICKIIGLFYVIPFYAIIGTQGGALYSYAYSIYAIFLSLSNAGIPIAMSKIISEYNALDYHYTKERAFKIGSYLIGGLGVVFFLLLIIFAPMIAEKIMGNAVGGNTVEGVTLVIRIVATALLIVPIESTTQGYLQGQNFIAPSSIANVIEQLVRVVIIIVGSFMALKVFNLSIETAVGIAVFAATIGCLIAYFYLLSKLRKNRMKLKRQESPCLAEKKITNKEILKKIILYALPFVIMDVLNSAYGTVDTMTVVSSMTNLGYSTDIAETSVGVITVWGTKLNMIIAAIVIGISTSLIPNVVKANIKKDFKDLNRKINQALQALIVTTLPMTMGLFFLAGPAWVAFYGYDALSIDIFTFFILQAITYCIYTILIDILQPLDCTKVTLGTLFVSLMAKMLLNGPMMMIFDKIGIPAYYAPIFTTLLTQSLSIIFLLYQLRKRFHIQYRNTFIVTVKTIFSVAIMLLTLGTLNLFVDLHTTSRMTAILITALYAVVGVIVYGICLFRSNLAYEVFGEKLVNKVIKFIPFIKPKTLKKI